MFPSLLLTWRADRETSRRPWLLLKFERAISKMIARSSVCAGLRLRVFVCRSLTCSFQAAEGKSGGFSTGVGCSSFNSHLEKRGTKALHVSAAVGFLHAIEGVVLPGCFANCSRKKQRRLPDGCCPNSPAGHKGHSREEHRCLQPCHQPIVTTHRCASNCWIVSK